MEGLSAILGDFGITAELVLETDASAAVEITHRQGLGKVRHLAVQDLWIQQRVRERKLKIEKVDGKINVADLMTKPLAGPRIAELMARMGAFPFQDKTVTLEE